MRYSVIILSSFEIQHLAIIITNTLIKFMSCVEYEIFYKTLLFNFPDNYQMLRCSYSFSIIIHIKSQNITCSNCTYNQCKENPSIFLTKIVVFIFVRLTSLYFWQILFYKFLHEFVFNVHIVPPRGYKWKLFSFLMSTPIVYKNLLRQTIS